MSISDPKFDTSDAMRINTQSKVKSLSELLLFSNQAPFTHLLGWLKSCCAENWETYCLGADTSNALAEGMWDNSSQSTSAENITRAIKFVEDNAHTLLDLSYESYIYRYQGVPTRDNWHDFFNALVWMQFPSSKAYFNACHYAEIEQFGDKKRTRVRDKLTHFDECGLVLVTDQTQLQQLIKEHDWNTVFIANRNQWHNKILPFIFGHALWEMLMNPFIGLTAKVSVICVDSSDLDAIKSKINEANFSSLDELFKGHLLRQELILQNRPWLPMPLLGIPNWSPFTQDHDFYSNAQYFMPKKRS